MGTNGRLVRASSFGKLLVIGPIAATGLLVPVMVAAQMMVAYEMSMADAITALRVFGPEELVYRVMLGIGELLLSPLSAVTFFTVWLLGALGLRPGFASYLLTLGPTFCAALWSEPWNANADSAWTAAALFALMVPLQAGARQLYQTAEVAKRTSDLDPRDRRDSDVGGFLMVTAGLVLCATVTFVGLAEPHLKTVVLTTKSGDEVLGEAVGQKDGFHYLVDGQGNVVSFPGVEVEEVGPPPAPTEAPSVLERLGPPTP